MPRESADVRRTVWFSGHVQGVGFRYTARNLARGFAVSGYVRNLPDGRVELVAEGSPSEVDRFVQSVEQAMTGYVRETRSVDGPASGDFESFGIRS
ncbi:MAG: acylphosphatase [Phycisphaerae bacterium]|jgi:acylphosphatase